MLLTSSPVFLSPTSRTLQIELGANLDQTLTSVLNRCLPCVFSCGNGLTVVFLCDFEEDVGVKIVEAYLASCYMILEISSMDTVLPSDSHCPLWLRLVVLLVADFGRHRLGRETRRVDVSTCGCIVVVLSNLRSGASSVPIRHWGDANNWVLPI